MTTTPTPALLDLARDVRKFAEMYSRLADEVITVTIESVDEDGRAYCINPAGNMEYPFVSELMNVREVTL